MDEIFIPITGFGTPRIMDTIVVARPDIMATEVIYLSHYSDYIVQFLYFDN